MASQENRLLQMLRRYLEQNKLKDALATCQRLNRDYPHNGEGWCAASIVACRLGNAASGLDFIARALALQPTNARFHIARANALVLAQRRQEAMTVTEEAVPAASSDPQLLDMAGGIYALLGNYLKAQIYYQRAVEKAPDNGIYQFNLATVKRFLGDSDGSEICFDQAIRLNPADYEACHLRSDLRTQTQDRNHIAELTEHLKACISAPAEDWRGEMKLCFSLAKEHEDLGNYEDSFRFLKRGADLRRSHMSYKVETDIQTVEDIVRTYSAPVFNNIRSGSSDKPVVFIVGLPRTGTTLVDRVISSHGQVFSAGELNNFALEMSGLARRDSGGKLTRTALIERTIDLDFEELGQRYLASVKAMVDDDRCFTDKLPLNFLYCGLIHKALPKAKIIHVQRGAMDSCYAMYKRLFADAYPMSYHLLDLGRYFVAYQKLMAHWYKLMPGIIRSVSYEDLVRHQEPASRRLIADCDLPWDKACLSFDKNPAAATTASASQVRHPVYNSSIGKWRNYQRQLQPLQALFTAAGIDY
ncbi:MAG: sulfotransferase family protein [Gammaproteobacteria bacterium]|jgi:tetratricopeptide (TPR) repeat protein|nr:sulfotransferase family protein [Gammaproteobacteria bacterium]MBT5203952.1 sulfotransferase family protein [Gammaproteobacteria bacterium]MBT5603370.1 sulfotransferase family protein [Gammaproteobacteria bacterium]MBT6245491.1 sulfotransferase family protein [Gammaproteobacteria bacterium]